MRVCKNSATALLEAPNQEFQERKTKYYFGGKICKHRQATKKCPENCQFKHEEPPT